MTEKVILKTVMVTLSVSIIAGCIGVIGGACLFMRGIGWSK